MEIIYNNRTYTTKYGAKYLTAGSNKSFRYRRLHQQKWFDNYGDIPKGYHIHHKDGNRLNNNLDNLEMIKGVEHCKKHMAKRVKDNPEWFKNRMKEAREKADLWQGSEAGIKHHIEHAKNFNFGHFDYGKTNCEQCGKEYAKKQIKSRFCSNNCKSAWRRKNNPDKKTTNCKKCGKTFITLKYLPRKHCVNCFKFTARKIETETHILSQ